jgi:hypothetical protein
MKNNENTLVILKSLTPVIFETDRFSPNTFYRCVCVSEGSNVQYMVYGIIFDEKTFNDTFEFGHTKVMIDWSLIGLVGENNKPISKTAFIKKADIHSYARLRIWFFGGLNGDTRFNYGFYPYIDTKPKTAIECYKNYLDTVNGDMIHFDSKDIQYGNCGIPLSYNDLKVR